MISGRREVNEFAQIRLILEAKFGTISLILYNNMAELLRLWRCSFINKAAGLWRS